MTTPTEHPPSPPAWTPPPTVTPEPDSRLEALAAEFAQLKPQFEELSKRMEEIKKGIKHEVMTAAGDGTQEAILRSTFLPTPYRVHAVTRWSIDSARLKREDPETYVRWARQSTSWRLDAIT